MASSTGSPTQSASGYYHHAPQQPQLGQPHQQHQSYATSQPTYDSYSQAPSFGNRPYSSNPAPRPRPDSPHSATSYTTTSPPFPPPTSYTPQQPHSPFHPSTSPHPSNPYYISTAQTRPPPPALSTSPLYQFHPRPQQYHYAPGPYGYPAHPSLHHTQQDRPFKCDQCPQSFSRNHDLKRHKRIHLAVKPFPCDNCDKSFSRKDALKRHRLVKGCGKASEAKKKAAAEAVAQGHQTETSPSVPQQQLQPQHDFSQPPQPRPQQNSLPPPVGLRAHAVHQLPHIQHQLA